MACQSEEHFQQLSLFIRLPAQFCTRIVAVGSTIAQRACDAPCHIPVKPRPHQQQCRSNIVELYKLNDSFDSVECCFDIVAVFGNNVEQNFVFSTMSKQIEHVQFVSTLLPFVATKSNVASTKSNVSSTMLPVVSTLLLVWTGPNAEVSRTCDKQTSRTTNAVDVTAYSSASVPAWTRTTVADRQIFGDKASVELIPCNEPTIPKFTGAVKTGSIMERPVYRKVSSFRSSA